jgi:hypothetical protein
MLRTRKLRRDAKADGKTFDDVMEEHAQGNIPFKFAERTFRSRKDVVEMREQSRSEDDGDAIGKNHILFSDGTVDCSL